MTTTERLTRFARATGSRATTTRGIVRYAVANPRGWRQWCRRRSANLSTRDWQAQQLARTVDPEAKRARDDTQFRRRWLARLRRQELAAVAPPRSLSELDARPSDARRDVLAEIRRLRSIAGITRSVPPLQHATATIPLTADNARACGASPNMRGKDCRILSVRDATHYEHAEGWTEWRNGQPKNYTRAVHDNYIRSVAFILNAQTIEVTCHTRTWRVALPVAYTWNIDQHGLRAIRADSPRDDFHPDMGDLLATNAGQTIAATIETNRKRREQLATERAVEIADARGIYVCVQDSAAAGNCPVGTRSFARKHNLDPARHYPAAELLTIGNGDTYRVRLAVAAARKRDTHERNAGFCLIEDHT